MCLTTKDPTIKTADRDIICYKHGEIWKGSKAFKSVTWKSFYYRQDEPSDYVSISARRKCYVPELYEVNEGYHSYNKIEDIKDVDGLAIFVIPKGSKYIEGYNNSDSHILNRVSSSLTFIGEFNKRTQFKALWKTNNKMKALRLIVSNPVGVIKKSKEI